MNRKIEILCLTEYIGEIGDLVSFWNDNLGDSFPITERLFSRNLLENSKVDRDNSYIVIADNHVRGLLISKKSIQKESTDHPYQVWLSMLIVDLKWRKKGIGSELIKRFEDSMPDGQEIIVGMDPYHLFPGIPVDKIEVINFLKNRGYLISGECHDLRSDIQMYQRKYVLDKSCVVRRLREGEQEMLLELIKHNFSQRWYSDTYDSLHKERKIDGTMGLFKNEELIGFAHVHTYNDGYIGPSVFWKGLLQEEYGGLGPIGVAKSHQGQGLGTAFFEEIILLFQNEGIQDMTVDWTILLNYYGKFGFTPWKTYVHASKNK